MDRYPIHRTIYDVTITSMAAGQLLVLDSTMQAAGVSYRTANPIVPTSTATGGQVVVEVDSIEVIPPIQSNGQPVFGPIDVWPVVDGQEFRHYTDFIVDAALLGWPLHARTYGGSHLARLLGTPWWRLCEQGLAGHPVANAPLKNTTIKYAQNFSLTVYSGSAWTAASGYGLRIIVKGWVYDAATVAFFAPGWQTAVSLQTEARALLN